MNKFPKALVVAVSGLMLSTVVTFGQTAGGGTGAPAAGSAGAGSAATSGVAPGPASPGGTNNVINDPSGQGNAAKLSTPPPPGTNSLGTANSSGSSTSATTGSTTPPSGHVNIAGPNTNSDAAISAEDKLLDKKIRSICKGC